MLKSDKYHRQSMVGGWTVLGDIAQRFKKKLGVNCGTIWEKSVPGRRNNQYEKDIKGSAELSISLGKKRDCFAVCFF